MTITTLGLVISARVSVAIGLVIATLLTGCVTILAPEPERTVVPTREPPPILPDGFAYGGNGLATKWITPTACAAQGPCIIVEVYAYEDCTDGVYVEVNGVDEKRVVVDYASGTLPRLARGQTGRMELAFTNNSVKRIEPTRAGCY